MGSPGSWCWVVAVAVAALAALAARSPPVPCRRNPRASLWLPELGEFDAVSARHVREARDATADFERAFQSTFGGVGGCAQSIRQMFAARARAARAVGEIRMRMPNDPAAETLLVRAGEDLDARMLDHIEDARQRCGVELLHPGPVGHAWYGAWYRAAGDDTGGVA